jgi:hypothetical protein
MKVAVATTTAISHGLIAGRHGSGDETDDGSFGGSLSAIFDFYFGKLNSPFYHSVQLPISDDGQRVEYKSSSTSRVAAAKA